MTGIPDEVTLEVDLAPLLAHSVRLLRTIQGLLLNCSSDNVRAHLRTHGVSIVYDVRLPRNDTTFTKKDVLESPFFVIQDLKPLPNVQNQGRRLSGNVSRTRRRVLDDFYGFDVTFREWNDFEHLIEQDIDALGELPEQFRNWGELLILVLSRSSDVEMGKSTSAVQELTIFHTIIRPVLRAFDFLANVNNGSDDDVTFQTLSANNTFLFSEGKESTHLPRLLTTDGHHLCTFGFATKVARIQWKQAETAAESNGKLKWQKETAENNARRDALQTYLKVGTTKSS